MKKKSSGGGRKRSSSPAAEAAEIDLKSMVRDHSAFFDRLVELIPARFYLPATDDKPWFQGLSKEAKASAKRESRENLKKARRARHDPSNPSNTLDLLHKSIQVADPSDSAVLDLPVDRARSLEELRHRYHLKMEEFRSIRNTKTPVKPRVKKEKNKKKNKRLKSSKPADPTEGKRKREEGPGDGGDVKKVSKKARVENGGDGAAKDLTFGTVKVGEDHGNRKMKRPSKVMALKKAERLEEAKKDPEKGEVVAKKHSWKAAVSRAAGLKVHDDPKLLKESIKKERRRRQKHAEKWKERVQSRDKAMEKKQKTRTDNIKERIQQRKMRRIEKREKKLMRPGFEGRKEGYINEPTTA